MSAYPQPSEPASFTHQELERALSEQSYGIAGFEMTSSSESSPLKATARVDLLEGEPVFISLTTRGYQLESPTNIPALDTGVEAEPIFETIELLLQSLSKKYEDARMDTLMAKVNALSRDSL